MVRSSPFARIVARVSPSIPRAQIINCCDGAMLIDDLDDSKPRKRGRPPKTPRTSGEYTGQVHSLPTPASQTSPDLGQAPHIQNQGLAVQPAAVPQTSPPRTAPQKSTLKALPTVRDHTTDQLGPEGDEYIARDFDDAGEKKVDALGNLLGGREYKIRTFNLPGRGEKLFMLATECARTLQYRDSYLLFNKNRSLFKIIASVKEKEDLVGKDILPYSYRSRQIAIVTARSMFRQFGSRVIKDGRRVRDDYWEAKAIKQGFTEADPAGEKRPGAARAREQAAQQDAMHVRQLSAYGDVVYSNGPQFGSMAYPTLPPNVATIPSYEMTYDPKYRDITRPRQDLTGPPYVDITRTSTETEMAGQAGHASEYSRNINQQGQYRRKIVQDYWHRPHEPPVTTPPAQEADVAATSREFASPRFANSDPTTSQASISQSTTQAMNPPSFPHQHNPLQSPSRQSSMSAGYGREGSAQFTPQHQQFQRSSSNLSISQSASQQPGMQFGGGGFSPHAMQQQSQAWGGPPPQPHQSPSMHRMTNAQFPAGMTQGGMQSPMPGHPSQSPHAHQMQPPQMPMMHHQGSGNMGGQQLFGPGAGLQAMSAGGFPGMNMAGRAMYGMGQNPNQFMQQGGQQPGQAWAQPGQSNQWSGQFQ